MTMQRALHVQGGAQARSRTYASCTYHVAQSPDRHALADAHVVAHVNCRVRRPCPCSKHTIGSSLYVNLFILMIDCMVKIQMYVSNAVAGVNKHDMPI